MPAFLSGCPGLITGAFANRVDFSAYLLFLTAWLMLVYFPFVHMVWTPDGLFSRLGVLDLLAGSLYTPQLDLQLWLQ